MRFVHTNIVASDFERLALFYEAVFGCRRVPPERRLADEWLERGTGVKGARLRGVHLRLPGHGESGPTLELFEYAEALPRPEPVAANRRGFGHIAFEVDDLEQVAGDVERAGGGRLGEIVSAEVPGAGRLSFVYVTDPEGNIIELQRWG
jgi:catechol 2,3-dioxygenase-like lactoylglutathione lyase family enzyme